MSIAFFKDLRAGKTLEAMFQPENGVDEIEALLLAKAYFCCQFGACGFVDMPEQRANEWVVQIASRREARLESPIVIDVVTGGPAM